MRANEISTKPPLVYNWTYLNGHDDVDVFGHADSDGDVDVDVDVFCT